MRLATTALLVVGLAGCGVSTSQDHGARTPTGWTTFHDPASDLTVRFPSTWHRASASLTPSLTDPVEILSVGTMPLEPGRVGGCAHMPMSALRATGPQDVFFTLQERTGTSRAGFDARSRPFELGAADRSEAGACVKGPRPWRSHWVSFSDAGRSFHLLALVGDDAPAERVRELHEVLDSLELGPSTPAPERDGE